MSDEGTLPPPAIDCYRLHAGALPIKPAGVARPRMDNTSKRYAYRCTPLNIANTSGWEVVNSQAFDAEWDGGTALKSLILAPVDNSEKSVRVASSHFGHGILTFHLGWLIRTSPGWAIWARGRPNSFKRGITPLEGIVESEWLSFPFTMNWRFTNPGKVRFAVNEAVAFLTLCPHAILDMVQPVVREIADDPELQAAFTDWRDDRMAFNGRLARRDPDLVGKGWQRKYLHGAPYAKPENFHIHRRRMREPSPPLDPQGTDQR